MKKMLFLGLCVAGQLLGTMAFAQGTDDERIYEAVNVAVEEEEASEVTILPFEGLQQTICYRKTLNPKNTC